MSLAFNGQITVVSGSHNTKEDFYTRSTINADEAVEFAVAYIIENKEKLERQNVSDDSEVRDEEIFATADMILPDGVNPGDTFRVEKLPAYKIQINDTSDIMDPSAIKTMYKGNPVWEVGFSVKTSWGDYDELLNSYLTIYVDAQSGRVIDMVSTDGG